MENRQMILVGGLGVAGVGLFLALIVSAMRGNVPEVIASNEREAAPIAENSLPVVVKGSTAIATAEPRDEPVKSAKQAKHAALVRNMAGGLWPEAKISRHEAREALAGVGTDAAAEVVWWMAINDVSLDPEVRKDLIEDLNEDGFSDPKHPGKDDLPLIESRIALIEDLAGEAVDDTNFEAFGEAYKDLVNMRDRLTAR